MRSAAEQCLSFSHKSGTFVAVVRHGRSHSVHARFPSTQLRAGSRSAGEYAGLRNDGIPRMVSTVGWGAAPTLSLFLNERGEG